MTELKYDGSCYNEDLATCWAEYFEACEETPRILEDVEWKQRIEVDTKMWQGLTPHPNVSIAVHEDKGTSGNNEDRDNEDEEDDDSDPSDEHSQGIRLGCYRSFPDYHQLFRDQQRIRATNIQSNVLATTFHRLRKLRSVVFTDYRGTARNGDSFQCARRDNLVAL